MSINADKIQWYLPIKTVSEANCSEHWTKKAKRHKSQQFFIRQLYAKNKQEITLPCVVTLTRLSPRFLDSDNLQISLKWIRDELSDLLTDNVKFYINKKGRAQRIAGRSDSDPRIKWEYAQEPSKQAGIAIVITPL